MINQRNRWIGMGLGLSLLLAGSVQAQDWTTVERAPLVEHLRLDGIIEAVQQATVSAQTSGRIIELPFDVNDVVDAGQLIVQLDDTEQRSRLNQAEANALEARSNVEDAAQQFERISSLNQRGVATEAEFDQARNLLNAAEARLVRAEAGVVEARELLDYTRISAPYSGIVTERHVELGESVASGAPLLSGFSLEQLRVLVSIPQQFSQLVRESRQAEVSLNDGRVLQTGDMTFFPFADPATHSFSVRMLLDEPMGLLFPGMLVQVRVPVDEREALWIPASSLIRRGELRGVYVLDTASEPRLRQVRIGVSNGDRLEVLAGLGEGERILIEPQALGRQPTGEQ